jgi:hypothetical protein
MCKAKEALRRYTDGSGSGSGTRYNCGYCSSLSAGRLQKRPHGPWHESASSTGARSTSARTAVRATATTGARRTSAGTAARATASTGAGRTCATTAARATATTGAGRASARTAARATASIGSGGASARTSVRARGVGGCTPADGVYRQIVGVRKIWVSHRHIRRRKSFPHRW